MSSDCFEEVKDDQDEKEPSFTEVIVKKRHLIKKIPLTIGIVIILLGCINMIIFFAIPNQKIKSNKRKLPNHTFEKPNIPIIVIHFILHFFVIFVGLFVILFSFENFEYIKESNVKTGLIVLCMLTAFTWFVEIGMNFSYSKSITSTTTVNRLISILEHEPPVDFIFIYSQDEVVTTECAEECEEKTYTCYSKSGVKIPVISHITSHVYNFTDVPELFYFNIGQNISLTLSLSSYFMNILNDIKKCDSDSEKVVEYYPLIVGTYVVSMGKFPKSLSKAARIASIIFGVGIYYELYTKSVPLIDFKQKLAVDVDNSINYDNIFTLDECADFGRCDIHNSKPKPKP